MTNMQLPILVTTLFALGCGSSRTSASNPGDAPVAPEAPISSVAPIDATSASPPPVAWQWAQTPDLFPGADLVVGDGDKRFVLSLAPGRRDDWHRAVTLSGPGWSVTRAPSGELAGAAMVADDTRLYLATYDRIVAGCQLTAFARSTGKLLWEVRLDGIGPIAHSKYSNRVQLRLIDGHPVVFGNEAKRYIEQRDAATGALISHELLPAQRAVPPIGEPLFQELDHMLATRPAYTVRVNDFLTRHVAMTDATHAARGAAFMEAVRQIDGLSIGHGAYRLAAKLVEIGDDFEVRSKRQPR